MTNSPWKFSTPSQTRIAPSPGSSWRLSTPHLTALIEREPRLPSSFRISPPFTTVPFAGDVPAGEDDLASIQVVEGRTEGDLHRRAGGDVQGAQIVPAALQQGERVRVDP